MPKYQYYKQFDLTYLTDNRKVLKTGKPIFSDKVQTCLSINLNGNLLTDEVNIDEVSNNFFVNIVDSLKIKHTIYLTNQVTSVLIK